MATTLLVLRTFSDPEADKTLTGFSAILEHLDLLDELVALHADFLRLPGNASHLVVWHVKHREGSQDATQGGQQLGLDHLDCHVVDKSLESDLEAEKGSVVSGE